MQKMFPRPMPRRGDVEGSRALLLALEPRVMFATAPLAQPDEIIASDAQLDARQSSSSKAAAHVVLIDTQLNDAALLERAVLPGNEVFEYDGSNDSAEGVFARLIAWSQANSTEVSSIAILSHGSAGAFELGNQWITTSTLNQTAQEWKDLGGVMTENAKIELLACDVVAPGGDGQTLINDIAYLTGADVYASTNLTGNGGDWRLEAASSSATWTWAAGTSTFDQQILSSYGGTLVNIAPVLDSSKSPALTAESEDAAPSGAVGTLVSSLVDFASPSGQVDNVTDPDVGALLGIAVTAADTTNGSWYYSINNGTNWNALGAVGTASARTLAADANTRIFFQPSANYFGTLSNAITFRAWDQTSGTNGGTSDLTLSATVLDQFTTAAYTNNNGTANWTGNWIETDSSGGGATAGRILVTGGALQVEAKTTNDNIYREADLSYATSATLSFGYQNIIAANGVNVDVQVSGDGGTNYTTLTTFTKTANTGSGTLQYDISSYIAANTRVRLFVSNNSTGDYVNFDNIQITYAGTLVGGAKAFSSATDTASLIINPVADTPSVTSATTSEDTQSTSGLVISRNAADGTEVTHFKITGITSGTLYKNDGTTQITNGTFITYAEGNAGLKFTPTTNFNGSGSFTIQASTSNIDAGLGGSTVDASITVNAVNDAPTITNASTVTLSGTDENTTSSGTTADTILTGASWAEVDSGALKGIAITSKGGNGTWQYSTDGTTWAGFGAVSATNALLITPTTQVRYVPDGLNGETATFGFVAWDQTTGTASTNGAASYANPGAGGGTTAYSTQSASASITVTSVNDAPTITNAATVTLTATDENTTSSGTTVSSILTSASWADVDSGAVKGIAITSKSGNGTWEYSTDGTTWASFGSVSSSNALLLTSGSQVRYVPDGQNAETATFGFVAWDQTTGTASTNATPGYANPGSGGGTTAYSSQSASASLSVSAVNDAPTITNGATVTLTGTDEDTTSSGTTVASILTSASWADADSGAVNGIAVTSKTGNGTWQYSTDGTTWAAFGAVSASNALLLTSTTQVRYVPDSQNGETATFGFVAWDQTSGTASTNGAPSYVNPGAGGGTSAYSSQAATASITVSSVNDAPSVSNGASVALGSTDEDTTSSGTTVSSILTGASYADVDAGASSGIAVTSKSGNGTWQYSTDGTTWAAFGSVSSSNALLLTSTSQVRYIPDAQNSETATFGFVAWDQTSGTASTNGSASYANPASGGGTTAYSSQSATASTTVTSVNDAPTITNSATVTLTSTDEDTTSSGTTVTSILTSASWADMDAGAVKGIAVTSKSGNGTWQYSTDGVTWAAYGSVSSNNALLLTSGTQVRYIPDGQNSDTATFGFVAWDQTSGTASTNGAASYANPGAGGGTTAYSSQAATASIAITAVNDAPTITNGSAVPLSATDEDTASSGTTVSSILTTASWADIDAGANKGIAVTGKAGNGTWQYSTDAVTWAAFGSVAGSNALLLTPTTQVRYVPDGNNSETASFSFVAWDQTSGTASTNSTPGFANPGAGGGATAFSSESGTTSISVTSVNDAPTVTNGATATITGTDEATTSAGTTVSSILTGASWADVDTGANKGIAITTNAGNGTWQYSTDGTTWAGFGAVSSSNALLLTSTTQVRYIPDGLNGETATFGFVAWDQTSGAASTNGAASYVDVSTRGGTTAYSTQAATASMTVTSVNDAPTITNGATVTLTGTDENTTSGNTTPNALLTSVSWADIDNGAAKGIAVTGKTGNGTWQFTSNGSTWASFGPVSASNALLLTSGILIRYIPDGLNGETVSFSFIAWDQTTGTASTTPAPSYANPGAGGGTTAYSTESASASMTVTSINDAPTINNGATVTLTGTDEDTTSSGTAVNTILTGASWADVDSGASKGIAVTSKSGNGTWQYSTDGATWAAFGSVSSASALLLTSTTQVRYIPDANNGETATFGFKAWDQTSGTASTNGAASYGNASVAGTTTAYSSQSATASMAVTSVNDAPTINNGATVTLSGTNEDTTSSGTTVNSILASTAWADVDASPSKGIAVTSTSGNGVWQYSTNGTTWASFGSVSSSSALLLTSTTQVRYVPDGNGGETAAFAFVAWDQTTGTASTNATAQYGNPGAGGGTTAYSVGAATASMTVTSVNDAPTITNGATITLTGTDEDTTSGGTTVSSMLTTAAWADVDSGAVGGIAVTSKSGNGTWQYSTDAVTWVSFGAVSSSNALLLTPTTQVRYIPDASNAETATFGFRAWDQTSGTASTNGAASYANPGSGGTTTAYSSQSATASLAVTAVNDAPTVTDGATVTLTGTDEDTTSSGTAVSAILTGASWADVDTGASKGIAITGKSGNGTWQYSTDGSTWAAIGSVSATNALLLTSTSQVRYIPDGINGETATFGFVAWDQTTGTASANGSPSYVNPGAGGGTTAYSSQAATASIVIAPGNDAPTITNGATVTLSGTDEDTTSSGTLVSSLLTSVSWADADTGAVKGIAVTSRTGNGIWQYSTDGATWASFGSVSSSSALLLTSTTQVRYIPDGSNGETAMFGFVAWDQTTGTASTNSTPGNANPGAGGGSTAYSSEAAAVSITATSINDAPTITNGANVALTSTDENTTSSGTTVASILTGASWADVDAGASSGIAITGQSGNGTWQYSTDGTTWTSFGTVSSSSALLLGSTTQVRYIPDGSNGETATFGFVAWDQTSGTASTNGAASNANPGSGGGSTAYSTQSATASLIVTAANDAPTITNGVTVTLTATDEDTASSSTTVDSILTGASWADTDAGASKGIAVTGKGGNGTWQYSTDGATWAGFGNVTASQALLLTSASRVRYLPDGINGETATFAFVAWDQTTGTASTNGSASYADPGAGGGASAYSSQSGSASITVTAVNDAPTISNGATVTLSSTDEDTASSAATVSSLLIAASWADVDAGASSGIAITGASGNGLWQYSTDGATWASIFGAVSSSNALLLSSTTQVRYVPNSLNGETATLGFKAWDQTSGTASTNGAASYADPGSGGGITAWSSASAGASITVTGVNDAPTIANGATVSLVGTDENTTSSGTAVSSILTSSSWADVDAGALTGIAITSKTGNGTWQYSTDGLTWASFGSVSGSSALLLGSGAQVRYVPDGLNAETATFGSVAWDQTTGTVSTNSTAQYANPGAGGGTTAYSSQSASASIVVTAVNDAPTITNSATVTLTGTDEDTTSSATTVGSILSSSSWADVDSGAVSGIAVTSTSGNGIWQFSTDGTAWTSFGSVSSGNSLLLTSSTQVRYLPDAMNGESATFGFRAWDQTSGTASVSGAASYANTGSNGSTTAYSSQSASASIAVTSVNDAPTITNGSTVTLTSTNEDTTSSGTAVSSILSSASWADVDSGALSGIAIKSKSGNGTWQYSTDGTTWAAFGAVSSSNALLLNSTTQVRYIPDAANAETATFGFVAWDQTSGAASTNGAASYANPGSGGGSSAYSSQAATASLSVTSVNDAPTITNGSTVTLTSTDENTTAAATTVTSILTSASWADVDASALKGIAITSKAGNGAWQYSTDGVTWASFGSVSGTSALLLDSSSQIRYVPDGFNGETASFAFVAWDRTSGTASINATPQYANPGAGGGTTAYSSQSATASLTVTSVNDAPTISNGASVTLSGADEDTTSTGTTVSSILTSASWADVDTGATNGIAITSKAGNGTWQYSTDGTTWAAFGAVSSSSALLLNPATQVRYIPDGSNGETATFGFVAWDQTTDTASTNSTPSHADASAGGGSSAYSTQAATASMNVSVINDAPTISNGASVTLTATDEDTTPAGTTVNSILTSASWADVDSGALKGIAITSKTGNGTWQYSTDGTTWASFGAVSSSSALLLNSTTQVRYIPDAHNGETATFGFVAWDQTSGSASTNGTPSHANPGAGGGTSAYSSQSASASITVSSVNDAPQITNGSTPDLPSTDLQTTSSSMAVSSILTASSWSDVDAGAIKGIAVTSTSAWGAWEYSTDGVTWTSFGAVTASNALLLTPTSQVRYDPDGLHTETATFSFVAWDQTTGTASTNLTPGYADASATGGSSAFSAQSALTDIVVTIVNRAPTITDGATVTLAYTDEDTASSATAVSDILSGASWADVDLGALSGVAVTATSGNGTWQFSTDATTWTDFGVVSSSSALLLTSTTQVRYIPDGLNAETATFLFRAWDQLTDNPSTNGAPSYADPGTGGGPTAYSSGAATATLAVNAVNDAPTISNGAIVTLAGTNEDTPSSGSTISSILTSATWADVDSGALSGIAVTSQSGNGTWQFSTDGTTWTAFGSVSSSHSLLLTSTTQVRYLPDGNNGESAGFGFIAWDQTSGTASANGVASYADPASGGGTSAYSAQSASTAITVTSVNDAPTVSNGSTVALGSTDEDTPSSGALVSSILTSASWADVDAGALNGIAIVSASGNGIWQYSTDGVTWAGFGSVSSSSALLLTSTTQVRYVPDGNNAETADFSFVAWDRTAGTASTNTTPSHANPGAGGGTSAYSSQSATASLTVTAVNDAPTIFSGTNIALTGTDEDTPSSAATADAILTSASWADVDSGAIKGIAITSAAGNGTWQYSTDGVTWAIFGSVSSSHALLLNSTTQIRYTPDSANGETATFGFVAWDQTSDAASTNGAASYANPSSGGGTSAFSLQSSTASLAVTSVNDAPTVFSSANVTLTSTDEDTTSSGASVNSILTGASWADIDTGASKGIAVTGNSGNGLWQYSTDGLVWTAFGSVSLSNALLLTSTTQVRYIPDNANGETSTFTFVAWDQTTDTASTSGNASYADPGVGGGTSAYSSQSASASMTISSVNDAPTITNAAIVALSGTDENTVSAGSTVSSILAGASLADIDFGALSGIAITATSGNGTWQYSTNGLSWTSFGAVSATHALLLNDTTQVRYIPDAQNGETATFAFIAWDQTAGSASVNGAASYANPGTPGGTSAYSIEAATASLVVSPVNDAPTLSNGATFTLSATNEDTTSSGTTVNTILTGTSWADVDLGALKGIAITSKAGNGTWQYSTDGTTWTSFGSVSNSAALLLSGTTQVRYIPNGQNSETVNFGFVAWDQTTDTASTNSVASYATTATRGGTSAYSSQAATASMTITPVNDAPTITNAATVALSATDENTPSSGTGVGSILTSVSVADVDASALQGIAVTGTSGNGTWQYSTNGTTWTAFGSVSGTNALLLDTSTQVRYLPDLANGETASFAFIAWDRTSGAASVSGSPFRANPGAGGGSSAYSSQTASATITVTSANDAPTITSGATVSLTGTDENTPSTGAAVNSILTSASWADVDSGALKGIAVTSQTGNGTWQYSTDGATWTAFGSLSTSNALLLAPTTQVRFVPGGNDSDTATFGFVAWDQTTGTPSANSTPAYANPGAGGGTSAYSTQSATASIAVSAVNNAPTLANGAAVVLTATNEDTASTGVTVSTILTSASWADADAGALKGIAITSKSGSGTWQYSTDGVTWAAFGTVSSSSALLVSDTARIRYVPDGRNGETATFGFVAWDQTADSASTNSTPRYANPGAGGGITAYSSESAAASITVSSLNDAPTITNGATVSLTGTSEGTTSTATTVSSILTSATWADVDTAPLKGIAIKAVTGNGTWQYSTDGVTWASFGTVSTSHALLLTPTSQVRYAPASQNSETATFTFVAWDQTSGTASTNSTAAYANPGAGGGTSAYSSQSASTSLAVTGINDAPTLASGANVELAGTDEDTTSNATSVSSILTGASWTDTDIPTLKGIAVTSHSGSGSWQYSTDGTTWSSFGAVSAGHALLLTSSSQVRYVPDGLSGETPTFAFVAWDQTTGSASTNSAASYANPAPGGGTSTYSTESATASMIVTSLHDAPAISSGATVDLPGSNEADPSTGTEVDSIVRAAGFSELEAGALAGMAVTGASGKGGWQYSVDGTTWTDFGSVASNHALLLDSTTQVRYVADGLNGETAIFDFIAWDQTTGTASIDGAPSYADPGTGGGTSAFSAQAAAAELPITPDIPLHVTADGADITSSQSTPVAFGKTPLGSTVAKTFTIANNSGKPMAINSIDAPPGYTLTAGGPTTLADGDHLDVTVSADATALGDATGNIQIATDNAQMPAFQIPVSTHVQYGATLGAGGTPTFVFTDADGTFATIKLVGPGTAQLRFDGAGISSTVIKKLTVIKGTNVSLDSIAITGATAKTKLIISTKNGDKLINVGSIASTAAMNAISAKTVRLTGALAVPALNQLDLYRVDSGASLELASGLRAGIIRTDFFGTLTAANLKTLNVAGSISNATITVAGDIGKIAARGTISNSTIRSTGGSILSLAAASLVNSKVYASVVPDNGSLPSAIDDFTDSGSAQIKALNVKSFANSYIAARRLGNISIGDVTASNGGTAHGIAATAITQSVFKINGQSVRLSKVISPEHADAQLTASGADLLDFEIVIVPST